MRLPRLLVPLLLLTLPLATLGCGGKATPTAEVPTASPVEVLQWPTLSVVSQTVQFREREQDALRDLDSAGDVQVQAGGNVVVGDTGRAQLTWTDFLSGEFLPGTDVLLSLSLPAEREVVLDQATGTARYVLQGAGAGANVQVKAAWANIVLDLGTADVLVSLVPGTDPAVWVVALEGSAQVDHAGDETSRVALRPGQVVTVTDAGGVAEPIDIDRAAVLAWYDAAAVGQAEGDISLVAFRCTASAASVVLRASPDADGEPVGTPLDPGTVVTVVERDADGMWLHVRPAGAGDDGWATASELACVAPVTQVKIAEDVPVVVPPTEVVAPRATRVVVITATPALLPPTPTPTVSADFTIKFWAEDDEIDFGRCTVLRWETNNIREVYYMGKGVVGNGSHEECPGDDATFTLRVVLRDGREETRNVEVEVDHPDRPTPAPATSTSPPPAATPVPPSETPPAGATTAPSDG